MPSPGKMPEYPPDQSYSESRNYTPVLVAESAITFSPGSAEIGLVF